MTSPRMSPALSLTLSPAISRAQAPGGRVSQYPPLPTSVTPLWEFHSEVQLTPTAWTDARVSSAVLAGTGTPVVAVDPGFFNGRVVAQAATTGSKNWANRALPVIAAAGTRPWYYLVARFRSLGNQNLVGVGITAPAIDEMTIRHNAGVRDVYFGLSTAAVSNGVPDTLPHSYQVWRDGTNTNFSVDGVNITGASAAGIANAIQALAIASAAQAQLSLADASVAYWLGCSAKPSAAEIALLNDWAADYWGLTKQRPPLPSSAVEYWHSELGVNLASGVDSWTGQLRGTALTYRGTRPAYGADGTYFNSRNAVRCARGSASLYAGGLSPIIAAGTLPYIVSIFRFRSAPTASYDSVFALGVQSVIDLVMQRSYFSPNMAQLYTPSATLTAQAPIDLVPHRWESWIDGVNLNSRYDGVLVTTPSTNPTSQAATSVGVGNASGGPAVFQADTSHVFHLICSSKPTDPELAALNQWAQAYWGVP